MIVKIRNGWKNKIDTNHLNPIRLGQKFVN